jgi:hypothetical protein
LIRAGNQSDHRAWSSAAAVLLVVGAAQGAGVQSSDVAVAEVLFREGKDRMAAKDYARACPKLADSYRLDPATGTLLALAMCNERANKLASAWAEYADAAARAKREARSDREKAAREKVAALEPRLSYLTILTARSVTETPGVEITRNGVQVGTATLGTAVPVDGGAYTISVTAPGKKSWSAQINVAPSGERHTLSVPPLDDSAPPVAPIAAKSASASTKAPLASPAEPATSAEVRQALVAPDSEKRESGYGVFGAATIAAGMVSVGIGTGYMLAAMKKNEDSKPGCDGDRCSPAATQDRLDARAYGNVATIAFLAGGVLVAMGTTLYIVGAPPKPPAARTPSPAQASASVSASPLLGPGAIGGVLQGTF